MDLAHFLSVVDRLAPFELAEPWDRVGLQLEPAAVEMTSVLVTVDVDEAAVDEAQRLGCQLILAHHPLIFDPIDAVTTATVTGRTLLRATRSGIGVVVAHTNLDKSADGLADIMCAELALENTAPLAPAVMAWSKFVGFVPVDDLEAVRGALFAAGAGGIGHYAHCSFAQLGQGSFLPREGAHPTVGRPGEETHSDELRLETVFPRVLRRDVIAAYLGAHSYEEPAFDIFPVEDEVSCIGLGRVGYLAEPLSLGEFAAEVAHAFKLASVRFTGDPERIIAKVACLPGSGGAQVAAAAGACDVLVTGDVKYHQADGALRQGLSIVDLPHDIAEQEALERWSESLGDALGREHVAVEFLRRPQPLWRESARANGASAAPSTTRGDTNVTETNGHHHLYTDGGARGNPGPAGIGALLTTAEGEVVEELSDYIGEATNNVAEYQAMISGLEMALDRGIHKLSVFADSELVVRQISGQYKVKEATLKTYHAQVIRLLHQFQDVEVKHIRREQNELADALVNQAIDAALE